MTLLILTINFNSFAQKQNELFENFSHLTCKGHIPIAFTSLTTTKLRHDYLENSNKDLDKEFFISTRFFIDELLSSGNILFNENLSNYVNDVATYVLKDQQNLRNELQFYVLKSTVVNAFSTDQGIIFVTTGLLSQLENEAQLAFILAHEITHYTENHSQISYKDKQNISKGEKQYRDLSYNDRIRKLSVYSKSNEFNADKGALKLFINTDYDIEEVFSSFDILLYADSPFENIRFDTSFFNTDVLYIPGTLFSDTINKLEKNDTYDDYESSHPNIHKRINALEYNLNNSKSKGKLKYKVSKERFINIQNLARFESINLFLTNRAYAEVIYRVFILKKEFPNSKFLNFSLAKALYGLAKYKNKINQYNQIKLRPNEAKGEFYNLALFIDNMNRKQINVLAYRYIYDLSIKYKNDTLIKKYERDMLKELALNSTIKPKEFLSTSHHTFSDSISNIYSSINFEDSIQVIESSNLSKYNKIRLKKSLTNLRNLNATSKEDFYATGLSELVADGWFIKELKRIIQEDGLLKQKLNVDDKKRNKQTGLGINKIVVVNPYLTSVKINSKKKKIQSEKQKIKLNKMYYKKHKRLDLDILMVDSKSLDSSSVEKYNELGLLHQWIYEKLSHDEVVMISSVNDKIQSIREKYNTEHFLYSGITRGKYRHKPSIYHLAGFFTIYGIPLVVADLFIVHNDFELVSISINSENDSIEYISLNKVKIRGSIPILETYIYDVLYKLNRPSND